MTEMCKRKFITVHLAKKILLALVTFAVFAAQSAWCAQYIVPNENLIVDGIPLIPADIADKVRPFGNFSSARMIAWRPGGGGMLVSARLKSTAQLFLLEKPGATLQPLTDFPDAVSSASFQPGK